MTETGTAGPRLRLARQARGFSQQQLAGMAGVSRQAVSAVEAGHSDPSLRVAFALAQALGMTVEELFGPADLAPPVAAIPVAPPDAPGGRVLLAPVGDRLVALPLRGDAAAGMGFVAAGGQAALPATALPATGIAGLPESAGPAAARPRARSPSGRSARPGRRWSWPAATRPCRCSRPRSRCSTRRSRSPGGRAAAGRRCGWPPPASCTRPGCTCATPTAATTPPPRATCPAAPRWWGSPPGAKAWCCGQNSPPSSPVSTASSKTGVAWSTARRGRRPAGCSTASWAGSASTGPNSPATTPGPPATLQVASAVAARLADAGVASEPVARVYGLDFVPLADERFDLVLPGAHLGSREVQGLLKVLASPWLLAQLASLPGYDLASCGNRVK